MKTPQETNKSTLEEEWKIGLTSRLVRHWQGYLNQKLEGRKIELRMTINGETNSALSLTGYPESRNRHQFKPHIKKLKTTF